MAPGSTETPSDFGSTLSRRQLARILGLRPDASKAQIDAALPRLLDRLLARLDESATTHPEQAAELRREIANLAVSRARMGSFQTSTQAPLAQPEPFGRREFRLGGLIGAAITLCLFVAYAAGYRVERQAVGEQAVRPTVPGILILDGTQPSAILRIFDADREELLLKTSAFGARVEVPPGRVALEVSREDCLDRWTRTVFFEERSTHRFEPRICLGKGELIIRSNVTGDRLRIDGIDVGSTTAAAHLLGVGDHEIRIDKAGYQSFLSTVRIRPNGKLEIRAELVPGNPDDLPRGRPLPVTKHSPEIAPAGSSDPQPFGLSDLDRDAEGTSHARDLFPELAESLSPRLASDLGRDFAIDTNPFRRRRDPSRYYVAAAGSTRWHDRVSADMIARYDHDASGQIDQPAESEAISCRVWLQLEQDFDAGGLGLSMVRYFGFDGSEWHPNALGFARAHRSAGYEKMKECGLQH
jgi:hypothetical protein